MKSYKNIGGVRYEQWNGSDENPTYSWENGQLESMLYNEESGEISLTLTHPSMDCTYEIEIPIRATKDWNEFSKSLPIYSTG